MSVRSALIRFLAPAALVAALFAPGWADERAPDAAETPTAAADTTRNMPAQAPAPDAALFENSDDTAAYSLTDSYGLLVRTGLSLVVVIILIWTAVQIMRRFSGETGPAARTAHVRVLDRTFLGPKKAIYVIRIGSRAMAVGVTDNQISPLGDLNLDETLAAYPDDAGRRPTQAFAAVFQNVRSRFAGNGDVSVKEAS